MIFLEGIIMVVILLSISWISMSIFGILKENIKSVYLEPAIMVAMVILAIYSIPKIARISDKVAISFRVYSQNMRRIYEVLEVKKDERFSDVLIDLLAMPVNMFHDQMKQDGRNFTPDLAQRITWVLQKIERLPRCKNREV